MSSFVSSLLPTPPSSSPSSPTRNSPTSSSSPIRHSPLQPQSLNPIPSSSKPKKSKPLSTHKLRSRLSLLCKQGSLDHARHLFDSFPRPVPTLLWNTLLIGYVCNSLPNLALIFFSVMVHHKPKVSPDSYTYSSALKACTLSGQFPLGQSIHCHLIRNDFALTKNLVLNNSLLNMYASVSVSEDPSSSAKDTVLKLFDRMPVRNAVSWNTLIAWYVKRNKPYDALIAFKSMIHSGIQPTAISFINIFPSVICQNEYTWCANVLYGLLLKHGKEYVNNLFIVSSAISMFSGIGDVESSRKIFNLAEERNIEVWNTMISGYEQNGLFIEAIDLFIEILDLDDVKADKLTFLSTLMAISQFQDVKLGQQVHGLLIKQKYSPFPVVLYNALLVMYSRCGNVHTAFNLFAEMPKRDLVSWNTMITALVQNNLNNDGLLLAYEMKKEGFSVDCVTLTALLSASSNLGSINLGKETHGYLIRHGIHFEGMESYLIDMYAKSGCVHVARQLFDESNSSNKDLVTWNAMLTGYTKTEHREESILIFKKIIEENHKPNSVSLSSLLCMCDIFEGKQIHGYAIRHGFDENIYVGTSLVDVYSKCGDISYAEKVFDEMPEKNTVAYTTMISGLGQHGLGHKALDLFDTMQLELEIKPDSIAFLTVISACRHSGLVDEGINLYKSMGNFGILPTPEHHCCIVDMLAMNGRVEEAYEFALGLGKEGEYLAIWGSILSACKLHGNFNLGKLVSEKIFHIEKDYGDNEFGYHAMISNLYAVGGVWDGVERVRREMRERGIRKEIGSSMI